MTNEYLLRSDDLLISRTNLQGKITYANPAFVEASGYSLHELLGADHNLVRHPEMPPEAFDDLWSTIREGHLWQGLVKNQRKNGQYYWVKANVLPIIEQGRVVGYASLRVCPERSEVQQAEQAYQRLNSKSRPLPALHRGKIQPQHGWQRLLHLPFTHTNVLLPLMLLLVNGLLLGLGSLFWSNASGVSSEQKLPGLALVMCLGLVFNLFVAILYRQLLKPARDLQNFALQMAAGNLSFPAPLSGRSDLGQLAEALEIMQKGLFSIAQNVYRGVEQVTPSVDSIFKSNQTISERVHQQATSIQTIADTLKELNEHVQDNARSSKSANVLALGSKQKTQEVQAAVEEADSSMLEAIKLTQQMSSILESLQGIAFQTNILALNAAVEAARAGQEGRGFAVVASEVKNLAKRSSDAATQASHLIHAATLQIKTTADHVANIHTYASQLSQANGKLKDLMTAIEQASIQQSHEVSQVNQETHAIHQAIQTSSHHADTTAKATRLLQEEACLLNAAVRAFRIDAKGRELEVEVRIDSLRSDLNH